MTSQTEMRMEGAQCMARTRLTNTARHTSLVDEAKEGLTLGQTTSVFVACGMV